MKFSCFIAVLIFTYSITAGAYDSLLFRPLTASAFEPRVGSAYHFSEEKLRLDIGTSVDLFDIYKGEESQVRFGTDFMTYTRLRTEGNFKFPVETSDYFFGVNSSYAGIISGLKSSARLRLAHISSHLVDGLADSVTFRRRPFVYSREFADGVFAVTINGFRPYLGLIYVFSTKPKDAAPLVPQMGFDYTCEVSKIIDVVAGYDFRLPGYDGVYSGIHSLQYGLLIKTSQNRGLLLSGYYYAGKSMHGMFYRENDTYSAVGFQVCF